MATVIGDEAGNWRRQAWVTSAMAVVFVAGFSFQLAMGRSSFDAPTIVHAHALVFFGWLVLALMQSWLAATGRWAGWARAGRWRWSCWGRW